MKTTLMTVALLIGMTSGSAWAQGKTPGRYPTPTAEGVSSSRQNSSSATSGQKNTSSMGTGSAHLQSGSGSTGGQTNGTTSDQGNKRKGGKINQQAAGVPSSSSSNSSNSTKPTKKQ